MADVFISYHVPSAGDIARRIADALKSAGISCWYVEQASSVGPFWESIQQEIKHCSVFLLILNEEANRSWHVLSEVSLAFSRYAENKSISILPFRLDNCALNDDMEYYLSLTTIVNGNPPDSQHIQDLTKRIRNLLARSAPKAKAQTETKRLSGF